MAGIGGSAIYGLNEAGSKKKGSKRKTAVYNRVGRTISSRPEIPRSTSFGKEPGSGQYKEVGSR